MDPGEFPSRKAGEAPDNVSFFNSILDDFGGGEQGKT
jgi:hypothetical protein